MAGISGLVRGEGDRGVQRVQGRTLPAGICLVEGTAPAEPELIIRIPGVVPDRTGIGEDERAVAGARAWPAEVAEVADEDSLELRMVAPGSCRGFAGLSEDAGQAGRRRAGQPGQRGVGDRFSLLQVAAVTADLVQCGQPAENP